MKQEKFKSNKALALFLCAAVLLFSIGLALARGSGGAEPYKTTNLILTQGDINPDLTSGISYDKSKYTLAVTDQGNFDINTPGTYVIGYTLTPITGSGVTAAPSSPAGSTPEEDQTQGQTPSGENPDGTKPNASTPGAESDGSSDPSGTKPADTAKPEESTPSNPGPVPVPAPKPDAAQDADKPDKPDTKPTPAPAPKPDTDPTPAPKPDTKPDPTPAPTPDKKPDTNSKPDASQGADKPASPAPDKTPSTSTDSAPSVGMSNPSVNGTALESKAVSSNLLAASHGQGSLFLSQNELTGDPAYGSATASHSFLLADASKDGGSASSPSGDTAPSKGTDSSDGTKPSTGDHSDSADSGKAPAPGAGDSQTGGQPAKPGTGDSQTGGQPAKPETSGSQTGGQSVNPGTGDAQTGDPTASPGTSDAQTGDPIANPGSDSSSQKPSDSTDPTNPPATDQTGGSGASGTENQTRAPAGGSTSQAGASSEQLEPITFTRNVVVNPAVDYQDIRMDVSNATPNADEINQVLLSGMKYDSKKYTVNVTDDGHFLANRIGEYKVSYQLTHAEDGEKIADLERYVWVTAPGVWFETQPLSVDASKDYDLFADIKYDNSKYDLSLVDKNAFDVSQQGPQRVMYRLTLRSGNEKAETQDTAKPGDGTGANAASPSGMAKPSAPDEGQTDQLAAAIFGREVTVDNDHFIHIDAPPLIVTLGGVQTVDLLEGVTATDEKGNPVKPLVVDRSKLDQSIKAAEAQDPSAAANGEAKPYQGDGAAATNPDTNQVLPGEPEKPASSATPADGKSAAPSNGKPAAPSDGKKDAVSPSSPFSSMSLMRSLPDFGAPSAANGTGASSDQSADKTTTPAMDTSAEATPPALGSNGSVIDLSKNANATLPANLPPGLYSILVGARDSATGEYTTILRDVHVLRSDAPITITGTNGINASADTFAAAFKQFGGYPKGTADKLVTYTITAHEVFAGYPTNWKPADATALTNMVNMGPYTTVVITSEGRQVVCAPSISSKTDTPDRIVFPFSSDYTTSTKFVLKNITLKPLQNSDFYIVANGSQLTLDTGFKYAKGSGTNGIKMYAVGGQKFDAYTTATNPVNTNLIVQGGENTSVGNQTLAGSEVYNYICGGNWNGWTTGTTHLTLGGSGTGNKAVSYVYAYGGTGGIRREGVTLDQTGDSYLTITGGRCTGFLYAGAPGTMHGNTHVNMSGGSIVKANGSNVPATLFGGSYNVQIGSCTMTITGGTLDTANGGGVYTGKSQTERCDIVMEIGGAANITNLYTGGANEQYGDSTVTVNGGTVGKLIVGGLPGGKGVATAIINGGKIANLQGNFASGSSSDKGTSYEFNVNADQTVTNVNFFDHLNLADNVTLAVTGSMVDYNPGNLEYTGAVKFGTNSVLRLPSAPVNRVGSLNTTGTGARLELVRKANQNDAPLLLHRSNGVSADKPLELKFVGAGADQATAGDALLWFNNKNQSSAGNTTGYTGSFPPNEYSIYGNPNTGFVRLGYGVSLQEGSTGPLTYYGTVAAAMNAIGSGPDYQLTVRKPNYALTLADGLAISQKGGSAGHITFTSGFSITPSDSLQFGEPVGTAVRRTVVIGSDPSLQTAGLTPDISFTTDTTVENMRLNYLLANGSIYANGHHLLVGDKVEINSDSSYFPALFGGSKNSPVASTSMEINSGKYSNIYGGGREPGAAVNGDTSIKVGGIGELVESLYGGGLDGNVTGNTIINISGGKLTGGSVQDLNTVKNRVVGGGQNGNVGGSCSITINGGTATGPVSVSGCDSGTVGQNVSIDITKGEAEQTITLPMAHVYGGGLTAAGQVMGNVTIKLNKGADYGNVSGGGRPAIDSSGNVTAPDNSVHGTKSITILGSVEAFNIVNFSDLNLGIAGGDKTTLRIKNNMDSNWGGAADKRDRTGTLRFYGGSVLNLTGADQSLAIGDLFTNRKENPSHLHIHKDANGTYPVYVAGQNISAPENKLVLGSVGDGQNSASGDQLLVFRDPAKADVKQYLPDTTNLDIVLHDNIIQYGVRDYPKVKLDRVTSDTPDTPDNLKTGVDKTLSFTFTSEVDGTAQSKVIAAYIDGRPASNVTWRESKGNTADLSPDATVIPINPNPVISGKAPTWNGTITRNIKQPDPTSGLPFYFVHVLADDGAYRTFAVDVHCPDNRGTTKVTQEGNGDYTLTVAFQDSKKDISKAFEWVLTTEETAKVTYTASGLYQTAWCVGEVGSGPPPEAVGAALQWPMNESVSSLHDVTIADQNNPFEEEEISFTVPQQYLGAKPEDMKNKVVYLFAKDWNGNTRQVAVPMSTTMIDVAIPLRAGVIAFTGKTTSDVAAPVCYVTNNSRMKVAVEIINASQDSAAAGGLTFVGELDENKLGSHEMNLEITEAPGTESTAYSFFTRPVVNISPTDPLSLGIMAPAQGSTPSALTPASSGSASGGSGSTSPGSPPSPGSPGKAEINPYVYFTFDALFNPESVIHTTDWNICKLTYRFTVIPADAPPAPDPAPVPPAS